MGGEHQIPPYRQNMSCKKKQKKNKRAVQNRGHKCLDMQDCMYAHVKMDLASGTMASRVTKLSKVHKGQDQTGPIDQTLHSKTHYDKSTEELHT